MQQTRYAYLFGANGPAGMQLQYAEKDVQRLASALQEPRYSFTAKPVIANSRDEVLKGLEECTDERSDLLLVHFSGHAIYKGQLYLLCNNSNANSLRRSAIDIRDIKGYLQDCKARQKLLILDCCHAGASHAGGPYGERGDDGIRAALHDAAQGSASIIFSACSRWNTTRELASLDGGAGFLSWLIHAACTDRFGEVSADQVSLSLSDIDLWIPTALKEVNATLDAKYHLPRPLFFGEWEGGSGRNIWFTDPPAMSPARSVNHDTNRTKYLQTISKRYNSVTLPIGPTEGFSLHAIFQPLALRSDPLTIVGERRKRRSLLGELLPEDEAALFPDAGDRHERHRLDDHDQPSPPRKILAEHGEDALKKSPHGRIIILGGPGTGKTTTLKHLVGKRAEAALTDPTAPVPIYLSLLDLARSGKTLQSYLVDLVEKMRVERSYADHLWQEIERGHAFVAFDSLDEVDPVQRPGIIDMINDCASEKGNTWLVGSRFSEYKGGQFKQGQFLEWELLPMTRPLCRSLIDRLFPELYRLFALSPCDPSSSAIFVDLLENHPQASAWSENPLLLSLAAVVYVQAGGLSPSRAALYQDVISAILAVRESSELRHIHLLHELTDLALWLYQIKGRIFTSDDLLDFLRREQHHSFQDAEHIAQRMISSGILDHVAQNTYGFRHQTFQEYLAGYSLAMRLTDYSPRTRQDAWDLAWSKRTYSRWTEILRLMVGVLMQISDRNRKGTDEALRWLEALMAQHTSTEGDPGHLGLALVLKSLAEVADATMWKTASALQLEQQVLNLWLDALFSAARTGRPARTRQLEMLAGSIVSPLDDHFVLLRLVGGLRDPDESVRWIAGDIVRKLGKLIKTETLLQLIQDRTENVRVEAMRALGEHGERAPVETLLDALFDSSEEVRIAAVKALGSLGERVPMKALLRALFDSSERVSNVAVEVLKGQGERVPMEVLLEALSSSSERVRIAAMRVLMSLGEQVPVNVFLRALSDTDPYVRAPAVSALGSLGERAPIEVLLGAFSDSTMNVRVATVRALGSLGERISVNVFLGVLFDTDQYMREEAVKVLKERGEQVPMETLLGMLSNANENVREAVVKVLKERGEQVPVEALLGLLSDSSWRVRMAVVEALGALGEQAPVETLLEGLSDTRDYDRRAAVVQALGSLGERVPIAVFLRALSDGYYRVREEAVKVLKRQRERVSVETLLEVLSNASSDVRKIAVTILKGRRERVSVEALLGGLSDNNGEVRRAIVRALGSLGEQAPIEVLPGLLHDTDEYMRRAVVEALGNIKTKVSMEALLGALSDSDSSVRGEAVRALGKQGERVPIEVLLEALSDSDSSVRREAVRALGKQGERVPIEVLLETLSDGDELVRIDAVKVIGEQGARVPSETLLGMLSNTSKDMRVAALTVLKEPEKRTSVEALLGVLSESYGGVREVTVDALKSPGEQALMEILLGALSESSVFVQLAAIDVLGSLGDNVPIMPLLGMLFNKAQIVRNAAVKILKEQGERVPMETLLGMLSNTRRDVRETALEVMRSHRERVPVEALLGVLSDNDGGVRRAAVWVLGDLGERAPIAVLLGLLSDNDRLVKEAAAWALRSLGERVPMEVLLELLTNSNSTVRKAAVRALGSLGERVPIEIFLGVLSDTAVKEEAMKVLKERGQQVSIETFLGVLTDSSEEVRKTAVWALASREEQVPVEALLGALSDSSESVRMAALEVLQQRVPEALSPVIAEAIAILQKQPTGYVLGSLIQISFLDFVKDIGYTAPPVLAKVTELLDWPYWRVRMKAAETLGELHRNIPDTAIRRLLALRHDPDPLMKSVRVAADDALAEILSLEDGIEDD